MYKLIYRCLNQYPEYKEELLNKVYANSDWSFLYGWLSKRIEESEHGILPRIYAVFDADENMVGYYVLSEKEVIAHTPDITPWLGIILVFDGYRGKSYSPEIIEHACQSARDMGYSELYLITEHNNFYERFGFEFICNEHYLSGEPTKLYRRLLVNN